MKNSRKHYWMYLGIAGQTRNTPWTYKIVFSIPKIAGRLQLSKYNTDSKKRRKLPCLSLHLQVPLVIVYVKPGADEKSGWRRCGSGRFLGGTADLCALTGTVMQELWPGHNILERHLLHWQHFLSFFGNSQALQNSSRGTTFSFQSWFFSIFQGHRNSLGELFSNHTFNTHFSGP